MSMRSGNLHSCLYSAISLLQRLPKVRVLAQAGQSEALRWACQAVAWLAQGMQLQGGFRRHPARYNHLVHRYEQRFAFLQRHGSPGAIPYEHLMHDMDQCEACAAASDL